MRESLKETESETCGVTNGNRIEGRADQGEWAANREALATKGELCKSGTRVATADDSYFESVCFTRTS